jgi:hypothetical protein
MAAAACWRKNNENEENRKKYKWRNIRRSKRMKMAKSAAESGVIENGENAKSMVSKQRNIAAK